MTSIPHPRTAELTLAHGDLTDAEYAELSVARQIAWDVETDGLDWRNDAIRLCQLYSDSGTVALVRIGDETPARLMRLLSDAGIRKVFHHAMFDLRFMSHQWQVQPRNIACTKIAGKLLLRDQSEAQRLENLLRRFLGITIDKSEQRSNWAATAYS